MGLTTLQASALRQFYFAALASSHIFPEVAACEAVVETSWGTSKLYMQANNVFGVKQHKSPLYGTINMPTKEFLRGEWVTENDNFVKYPGVKAAFDDRMATLGSLSEHYPHYAAALAAQTPEEFVTEVSKTWSTDPKRAETCIAILHAHRDLLQ